MGVCITLCNPNKDKSEVQVLKDPNQKSAVSKLKRKKTKFPKKGQFDDDEDETDQNKKNENKNKDDNNN
jgi:hypothetical protein